MSKIPKHTKKELKSNGKYGSDDIFAYRSVITSVIFGILFYIVSLFFNTQLITIFMDQNIIWDIIDILIKVMAILLFFLFMITSIGNYKELIGKPVDWKELTLLFIISLGQTLLNIWVFTFTLFGLILILIYLFFVQEK